MPGIGQSFIGREDHLRWLQSAWDSARQGIPQLCVLRGESGFGKTRLVQEFYSWLGNHPEHNQAGYWPRVLGQTGESLRLNPVPAEFGQADTIPWIWWGIRWQDAQAVNAGEHSSFLLWTDIHHLEPHYRVLTAAGERRKRWIAAAVEIVGQSISILGWGKTIYELYQLYENAVKERGLNARSLEERQAVEQQRQSDFLHTCLEFILRDGRAGRAGMPFILVLDDTHWMDVRSVQQIERLLRDAGAKGWPLLVLATTWERDWNELAARPDGQSFAALCTRLRDQGGDGWQLHSSVRDVGRLAGLERLLATSLPGLTAEQAAFLCARADGNPLLLEQIILELLGQVRYFEGRNTSGKLSDAGFEKLQRTSLKLEDVQKRRFADLSTELQDLLGYAGFQGMRFLRALTLEVAADLSGTHAVADQAMGFEPAVNPYAIVAEDGTLAYEFRHRIFRDLARAQVEFEPDGEARLRRALLRVGAQWIENDQVEALPFREAEAFCLLLLDQLARADGEVPDLERRLLRELTYLYLRVGMPGRAREWFERLRGLITGDVGRSAEMTMHLPEIVLLLQVSFGDPDGAVQAARDLVAAAEQISARQDADAESLEGLVMAQLMLAQTLREAGKADAAQDYLDGIMTSAETIAGMMAPAEALRFRARILESSAMTARQRRDGKRAIAVYEELLLRIDEATESLGETLEVLEITADTLESISVLFLELQADRPSTMFAMKALAARELIVERFGGTLEPRYDVVRCQDELASRLQLQGLPHQALKRYEQVLATHRALVAEFGPTPERLGDLAHAQERLAWALLDDRRTTEALTMCEQALATAEEALGSFEVTASGLEQVAYIQGQFGNLLVVTGDLERAREMFERALATYSRLVETFEETESVAASIAHLRQDLERLSGDRARPETGTG